jgi:hypothetical protein
MSASNISLDEVIVSVKNIPGAILPDNTPTWVRCYDNRGRTLDRFSVVFTGGARFVDENKVDWYLVLGMSTHPTRLQGVASFDWYSRVIDRCDHFLGDRIEFSSLPAECQTVAMTAYKSIWEKK